MTVKEETDQLTHEKVKLKHIWESILSYLNNDLGLIWTEEVKQRFEELKTILGNIKSILEKDTEKYSAKLKAIDDIKSKLKKIEPTDRWVDGVTNDIRKLFETEKTISRRGFLWKAFKAAVAGAVTFPTLSSRARAAEPGKLRVDFFILSMKNSFYSKEGYALALDYLRKEIGIDAHFHFCKKEKDLPTNLDNRKRLVIHEMEEKRYLREAPRSLFESAAVGLIKRKKVLLKYRPNTEVNKIKEDLENIHKAKNDPEFKDNIKELRLLNREEKYYLAELKTVIQNSAKQWYK
jgi:hypothetical protein